jgi:hypothetical protein
MMKIRKNRFRKCWTRSQTGMADAERGGEAGPGCRRTNFFDRR